MATETEAKRDRGHVPWLRFPGIWAIIGAGIQGFNGYQWPLNGWWPIAATYITRERGWTAAQFGLGRTAGGITAMIVQPTAGWIADNWGPRWGSIIWTIFMAVGFIGIAYMTDIWQLVLFYGVLVYAGMTGGTYRTGYTAVNRWWMDWRSVGITCVTLFGGMSGVIGFLVAGINSSYGWRGTAWIASITTLVLHIPAAFLMLDHMPEHYGMHVDNMTPEQRQRHAEERAAKRGTRVVMRPFLADLTPGQALRDFSFWMLTISSVALAFGAAPVTVFQNMRMTALGYTPEESAAWFSLYFTCSYVGRFISLFLGDWMGNKWPVRFNISVFYLIMAAGLTVFALGSEPWHFFIWAFLHGTGFGFTVPYAAVLMGAYFGRSAFGTIYGLRVGLSAVGTIVSPTLVGWITDMSGGAWTLAFAVVAAGYLLGALLICLAVPPKAQTRERVRT